MVVEGGVEVIFNLSASPRLVGKQKYLETLLSSTSGRLQAGYVYVSSGPWESSGDLVFSGYTGVYENGVLLMTSETGKSLGEGEIYTSVLDIHSLRSGRGKTKYFPAPTIPVTESIDTRIGEKWKKPESRFFDPYPFLKKENYEEGSI